MVGGLSCCEVHESNISPRQSFRFLETYPKAQTDVLDISPSVHVSRVSAEAQTVHKLCNNLLTADCRPLSLFYNHAQNLRRPTHAQLVAMERHPRLVQRPLHLQVDLGESVKDAGRESVVWTRPRTKRWTQSDTLHGCRRTIATIPDHEGCRLSSRGKGRNDG